MNHTHTDTPNFSVICPGGCNSHCSFCTDPMNYKTSGVYMDNLVKALKEKDPKFDRVSITGGEPTLSPLLPDILIMCRLFFNKLVFTTNGTKLTKCAHDLCRTIDHLNVSRHRIGYDGNVAVFKQKNIISDEELTDVIPLFLNSGVDVNFNHVYGPDDLFMNRDYVMRYIDYVRKLGGTSISFRHDQNLNTLDNTEIEQEFLKTHEIVHEGYCSVCRSFSMVIEDMVVVWKSSFANPDSYMKDEVYEYIYHTDGILRTGWERN